MAQPKRDEKDTLLESLRRAKESLGTVVDERFYVVEVTPAWYDWGFYGGWVDEKPRKVSPNYQTRERAQEFIDGHLPDKKDNFFVIKQEKLYERTVRTWI